MRSACLAPVILALALAEGVRAGAQTPPTRRELVGFVRDPAGTGIEGATVEVKGASAGTDLKGNFRLWTGNIDTLTISIRRIGYAPLSAVLTARSGQWDTVVVELERSSQELSAIQVTGSATRRALGLRDFDERRAKGHGLFVTREEIVARNTEQTSDVLRGRRGVNLVRLRNGTYGVRFAAYSHSRPNCAPDIWIDGQSAPGMEVDDILANDIEGIELYESLSTVPFEFTPRRQQAPCGTIAIWTRIPGSKNP